MCTITKNLIRIKENILRDIILVVVSKNITLSPINTLYRLGHIHFGESYVQELLFKYKKLSKNIRWHMIGNLQSNKIKYLTSFIYMIHSVISLKQLFLIDNGARRCNRIIKCLLQVKISSEKRKIGLSVKEVDNILNSLLYINMQNIRIVGLMGVASKTNNVKLLKKEYKFLHTYFVYLKHKYPFIQYLSMGMSDDYRIAIRYGANIIRLGNVIFN